MGSLLIDILRNKSIEYDKGIYFINGESDVTFLSYAVLHRRASNLKFFFKSKNFSENNKVILYFDDNESIISCFWGCIYAGIVPIPMKVMFDKFNIDKLKNVISKLGTPYLLSNEKYLKRLSHELEHPINTCSIDSVTKFDYAIDCKNDANESYASEDEIAFIQFSSGSTGNPKGVVLTHRNILSNINSMIAAAKLVSSDSTLNWMPLTHDMGLVGFHLTPLFSNLNQYHIPVSLFIKNPSVWLKYASLYKVTILGSPNFGLNHFLQYTDLSDKVFDLKSIRLLLTGAEMISLKVLQKFINKVSVLGLDKNVVFPVYGMAEAVLGVSFSSPGDGIKYVEIKRHKIALGEEISKANESEKDKLPIVSVGKALDCCDIKIVDCSGNMLGDKVNGLIKIKGKNVTNGYFNDDAATGNAIDNEGWLSTGDTGFIIDNELYITGREKDLLVIQGQNIYIHDIEEFLYELSDFKSGAFAVCGFFDYAAMQEELLCFVKYNKNISEFLSLYLKIQIHLRERLGIEVINIIPVSAIPKTTSGKIRRYQLVNNYIDGQYNEIINDIYKELHDITGNKVSFFNIYLFIQEFFKNNNDILDITFAELGGNSLKLIHLVQALQKRFGLDLRHLDFFGRNSVRDFINGVLSSQCIGMPVIKNTTKKKYYKATPSQNSIFLYQKVYPSSRAYNIPILLKLSNPVNPQKLENCLNRVIEKNESLRTCFIVHKEQVVQVIEPYVNVKLCINENMEDVEIEKCVFSTDESFNLQKLPLLRGALYFSKKGNTYLFLNVHHIIIDGLSVEILIKEIFDEYTDSVRISKQFQFKDYSEWYDSIIHMNWFQSFKKEMINKLSHNNSLALPYDYSEKVVDNTGKTITFKLDDSIVTNITNFTKEKNCTDAIFYLLAYTILLNKYTDCCSFTIGIPLSGRIQEEFEDSIGMFVNSYPFHVNIPNGTSIGELQSQINDSFSVMLANSIFSFELLDGEISVEKKQGQNSYFNTMFVFSKNKTRLHYDNFDIEQMHYHNGTSKYDLTLFIDNNEEECWITYEYNDSLFHENTIYSLFESYCKIINEILKNLTQFISELDVLPDVYRENIRKYNNTMDNSRDNRTLIERFKDVVTLKGEEIAIVEGNTHITYNTLNEDIIKLSSYLIDTGISSNDVVGLIIEPSYEAVVSIMATLHIGAIFLPIEPNQPSERIKYVIEDSNAKCILTNLNNMLHYNNDIPTYLIRNVIKSQIFKNAISSLKQNNYTNAYIIYTSGTTGKPKGVIISHNNLLNYINFATNEYLNEKIVAFPLFTSLAFDLTLTSIFVPILNGRKIIIYNDDDKTMLLDKIINDNKIDIIKVTPSHIKILDLSKITFSKLKKVIVGGEIFSSLLASKLYKSLGSNCDIYNEYGPTEATIGCMVHKYTPEYDTNNSVSIGKPIPNVQIYVCDKYGKLQPPGVIGEIYIAGESVANGYLNSPILLDDKFVLNTSFNSKRMYKSGDLGKHNFDGSVELIGRKDLQIKFHGYRIDFIEIENTIKKYKQINEVAIDLHQDKNYEDVLVAYISYSGEIDIHDLRSYLKNYLMYYMIPSLFYHVEQIPLNRNGKIDYESLRQNGNLIVMNDYSILPSTEEEKILCMVWKDVFNNEKIGINTDFYDVGGDSIKAIQICAKLNEMGYLLTVSDIMGDLCISNICKNGKMKKRSNESYKLISGARQMLPIELWFFSQQFKVPSHYNQTVVLDVLHDIQISVLEKVFVFLINHHDGLRINYNAKTKSIFYNQAHINDQFCITKHALDGDLELANIEDYIAQLSSKVNYQKDLMLNVMLIHCKTSSHLLITAHHLIIDGISWQILISELIKYYSDIINGKDIYSLPKTASAQEWYLELCKLYSSPSKMIELDYWNSIEKRMSLRLSHKIRQGFMSDIKIKAFKLSNKDIVTLETKYREMLNVDLYTVLLTILLKSLKNIINNDEFIVELENHGRHLENIIISNTIGWFTSLFPQLLQIKSEKEIDQLIEIKEQINEIPNYGLGFGYFKYISKQLPMNNYYPDFRFNYLGQIDNLLNSPLFAVNEISPLIDIHKYNQLTTDMEIISFIKYNKLEIRILYNKNVYDDSFISRFINEFNTNVIKYRSMAISLDGKKITPSDFSTVKLNQDELNELFDTKEE